MLTILGYYRATCQEKKFRARMMRSKSSRRRVAGTGQPLGMSLYVQTYLDLFARGGRDLKQAEYLFEKRIAPSWVGK
jgi:hypothetical protein